MDVIMNEVYAIEVVGKYEGVLRVVFCGGEGNK